MDKKNILGFYCSVDKSVRQRADGARRASIAKNLRGVD